MTGLSDSTDRMRHGWTTRRRLLAQRKVGNVGEAPINPVVLLWRHVRESLIPLRSDDGAARSARDHDRHRQRRCLGTIGSQASTVIDLVSYQTRSIVPLLAKCPPCHGLAGLTPKRPGALCALLISLLTTGLCCVGARLCLR